MEIFYIIKNSLFFVPFFCSYKRKSQRKRGLERQPLLFFHQLRQALFHSKKQKQFSPPINQGCQFTSQEYTEMLHSKGIKISEDAKGRAIDNIFIERL